MTSLFPDVSLSTERLVLRPFEADDAAALADMMNDEPVAAWTTYPHPFTRAHARDWITHRAPGARLGGEGLVLAVTEFLTQRLVGAIRLSRTDWDLRATELSCVTASWARGEGYAAEAALAVAHWLFTDRRFARVELRTAADNTAAQQVAQRIGCISEGVLRGAWIARHRDQSGVLRRDRTDLIVWSLLPEDLDDDVEAPAVHEETRTGHSPVRAYADWN
ncbi:GNAT family N-acetyltransferase [Streptomyces sp. SID11385]|uniref:GNAT family N-acetyltransferase n=1 Tax=Streptomyces sp. SID11385 TaxID=2706031 RepID=UPI0013C5746E|nr:GNAT family N-acetyltransferase [Streptomyces sp. SID11385]NEA44367.1 GNAT family N-acetyltransferase [Streptomyces sp. SID11385]